MIRLGVLVSGSGSNLQAILDAIAREELDAKVEVVISNVAHARAVDRAKAAGVPTIAIDHRTFESREAFDAAMVESLRAHGVEWVVLAGFMRVVTPVLLDAFKHHVINIHPSLLPAFPGVRAQKQAFQYGAKVTGCTVHFVDTGMDTGPIIGQRAVTVLETDTESTLTSRILEQEHQLLIEVLEAISDDRVELEEAETAGMRPRVRVKAPRVG